MYETVTPKDTLEGVRKPYFSIIMPVYNAGEYLRESLHDIQNQDFQDWEAVIVDDGSTDNSVDIAESFGKADRRIKVFRSDKNSGGAHAPRMRAASLARANYLVTIDADDRVSGNLLKTLYEYINSTDADLVIPEMWRLEGNASFKILPLEHIDSHKTWNGRDLVAHTLRQWAIPMAGFAIRRGIYIDADSKLRVGDRQSIFADELHSRWILFLCSKVRLCDARYFYRNNGDSVTNINILRAVKSRMLTAEALISMTAEAFGNNSETHLRAIENKFTTAIGMLRLINRSGLDNATKRYATENISTAMDRFDFSILKGRISPRYLALMRLPIPIARKALKFIDSIIKFKNGI